MEQKTTKYWNYRGREKVVYKNEIFYTITPLPLYVHRRNLVYNKYIDIITNINVGCRPLKILDFGCGDGLTMKYISSKIDRELLFSGVDISVSMIRRAKENFPKAKYFSTLKDLTDGFDLVYSSYVFAHIVNRKTLLETFDKLSHRVLSNGYFVLFEQTGPVFYGNDLVERRPYEYYVKEIEKRGFLLEFNTLAFYNLHRLFERHVAKWWYRTISKGDNEHEKRLNANKSMIFRILSQLFVCLSSNPVRKPDPEKWGYSILVFKKI